MQGLAMPFRFCLARGKAIPCPPIAQPLNYPLLAIIELCRIDPQTGPQRQCRHTIFVGRTTR